MAIRWSRTILEVDWELNNAGKNGYPFYMEKEIRNQPDAIERTITNRITSGMPDFTADGVPDEIFTQCERVNIYRMWNCNACRSCGTGTDKVDSSYAHRCRYGIRVYVFGSGHR